jgi:hypothetical protein
MKTRRTPRAARALALAAAAGLSFALYAQTIGLRPGLYEFTSTADVQLPPDVAANMPPQALAMMQKPHVTQHCISQGDIDHVSQEISQGRSHHPESCKMTEHSISGNEVKFTSQCQSSTTHFEGTFAGDSFQGTAVSTGDEGRMLVKIAAHRVGECSK